MLFEFWGRHICAALDFFAITLSRIMLGHLPRVPELHGNSDQVLNTVDVCRKTP